MARPCQMKKSVSALLRCFSPLSKDTTCVCVCVQKEKKLQDFFDDGNVMTRYSQTPVTQPPKKTGGSFSPTLGFAGVRLFSRKNTATSCRKSRYLGGGGRILDPSTSWRCQQGGNRSKGNHEVWWGEKKTSKELPKVAEMANKKTVYFENSYVKRTV